MLLTGYHLAHAAYGRGEITLFFLPDFHFHLCFLNSLFSVSSFSLCWKLSPAMSGSLVGWRGRNVSHCLLSFWLAKWHRNLIIQLSPSLTLQLPIIPSVIHCLKVSILYLEQRVGTFTFGGWNKKGTKEAVLCVLNLSLSLCVIEQVGFSTNLKNPRMECKFPHNLNNFVKDQTPFLSSRR